MNSGNDLGITGTAGATEILFCFIQEEAGLGFQRWRTNGFGTGFICFVLIPGWALWLQTSESPPLFVLGGNYKVTTNWSVNVAVCEVKCAKLCKLGAFLAWLCPQSIREQFSLNVFLGNSAKL